MAYELFNDEHHLWRQSIRSFMDKEIVPNVEAWEEAETFDLDIFKKLGELGYLGLRFPLEYGGGNKELLDELIFIEEVQRACPAGMCASIHVHCHSATELINDLGSHEQKVKYLVPAIKGEKICAMAITEPNAGSDVAKIETFARRDGGDYIISGEKTYITNGTIADQVTLVATTDPSAGHKGISIFMIEKGMAGFEVAKNLKKMGHHTGHTAELVFRDVRVPKKNLLGEEGKGFYAIAKTLHNGRMLGAAIAVVRAESALDVAVSYAKSRKAFGKRVADSQAVRHKLVEMATEIECARQLTYYCYAKANEGKAKDCAKEIAMAKWYAVEVNNRVCVKALQILRDIGCTKAYPVERILRDSRAGSFTGGSIEIMKELIARHMQL